MKITIIILTILYLVLTIISNWIAKYRIRTCVDEDSYSTEKADKIFIIENICRVASYAAIIIDVIFILAFFS